MAAIEFSLTGSNTLQIGSFNVHSIGNKLESQIISDWLIAHDIVFLCEIKTGGVINVPGFKVIYGSIENPDRGGVALLVKRHLVDFMTSIDLSENDQIWFRMTIYPNVQFGACYIPPNDSLYYKDSNHAFIQAKCADNPHITNIVFGDLNSRLGLAVSDLVADDSQYSYDPIDTLKTPNTHGRKLLSIAKYCDMVMVNYLVYNCRSFRGGLSFRKKHRWISEIDVCLIDKKSVSKMESFFIDQRLDFPSDHAPMSIYLSLGDHTRDMDELRIRANQLGVSAAAQSLPHRTSGAQTDQPKRKRPIRHTQVNQISFVDSLDPNVCDRVLSCNTIDDSISYFTNTLYDTAKENIARNIHNAFASIPGNSRWQKIMNSNDDKALWRAINWKGEFGDSRNAGADPTCEAFQQHLETVLYPGDTKPILETDYNTDMYLPVLDNPIEPQEVEQVIQKQVKPNKSSGIDGLGRGILKLLPIQWILALTFLLNSVFYTGYPCSWVYNKLSMVFKKGDRTDCNNYRGISIMGAIAKIYDYVLYNRLTRWFTPEREQAGAQSGRSCTEHILTLRLLYNYCVAKRLKLFVVFVDFSKAYDKVPRSTLLQTLIQLGCSSVMTFALVAMYKVTKCILGTAVITSTIGVRQGSPRHVFFSLYM